MMWTRTRSTKPDYALIAQLETELGMAPPGTVHLMVDDALYEVVEDSTTTVTCASWPKTLAIEAIEPVRSPEPPNQVVLNGLTWLLGQSQQLVEDQWWQTERGQFRAALIAEFRTSNDPARREALWDMLATVPQGS